MKDALISVVIVTYNSVESVPALRQSLEAITTPLEIVVIDNASADSTVELVRQWSAARVIANPQNRGFGSACNQGAALAQGQYILFLNPDARLLPDTLDRLMATSARYPQALICPTTLRSGMLLPERPYPIETTAAVPGCALFLPLTIWQRLGGFDEQMFLYWEDIELCWRAWLAGFEVIVDLGCAVIHDKGASAGFRRWDAEMTKNSIYSHLKLLPWGRVGKFMLRALAASGAKTVLGRWAVWRGWWWNLRHLPHTLRLRRHLATGWRGDLGLLVRRIEAHEYRQRLEQRNPRTHGAGQCAACWSLTMEQVDGGQRCFTCGFVALTLPPMEHQPVDDESPLDAASITPTELEQRAVRLGFGEQLSIAYVPTNSTPSHRWTPFALRLTLERAGLRLLTPIPATLDHDWQGLIRAEKTT